MKCKLEIIGEFSEWSNTCQECSHYKECMNKCYESEKNGNRPSGENFPTYSIIHLRKILNTERKQMVEKLLIDNLGKITQDDLIDLQIDLGRYNAICTKKKQGKRREKKS